MLQFNKQVPKFKEFLTETDVSRRDKPMTVSTIVTIADSKDPKENTTTDLISNV